MMTRDLINRRACLGLAAGGLALAATGPALARPRKATRPAGGVRIDTSEIARRGLSGYARAVEASLARAYASIDLQLPPGATLLARIDQVILVSYAGGDFGPMMFGEMGESDSMSGVVTLIGADGAVIATYPLLATLPAGSSGAWYLPDNDQRRLASICLQFARWSVKGLGL